MNVEERAVAPQNRQGVVKDLKVFLLRHVREIADHEFGREVRIAAGSIGLLCAGQIQARARQKIMFEIEARAIAVLRR